MPDFFEVLYENELAHIRKQGADFARRRPKIADRLRMDHDTGVAADPHVERLIEAFAFLTARTRLKLEDEFPELTQALLTTLYPHYLAPIPSFGIAHFEVDPQRARLPQGHTIPRHSKLIAPEVRGLGCTFRTAYPVTLWPLEVASAGYQTPPFDREVPSPSPAVGRVRSMIRIRLNVGAGMSLKELELDKLRFFLNGDDPIVHKLYELIFNHAVQVTVGTGSSPQTPPLVLPPDSLKTVGFDREDGLLPYSPRSFIGYRLLTEYFAFPSKFLFFDVTGLERLAKSESSDHLEIFIYLNRAVPNLEPQVTGETFRLGCTPIVNLFEQSADPIRVTQTDVEYLVIPDVRHHDAMEVYSVDAVQSTDMNSQETIDYQPFYALRHAEDAASPLAYWVASRRASARGEEFGSDVFLSLVDMSFKPTAPPADVLTLRVTCTNRDLPEQLQTAGGEKWQFQFEGQAPVNAIWPLVGPTATRRLPEQQWRWRLLSHLSLNHLSIVDGEDAAQALRELLRVYDFVATRVTAQHIDGIMSVNSRRKVVRVPGGQGQGFCRGLEIDVTFDEEKYAGSGAFLLAAVLERFLGMYATINSATSMVAVSSQRGERFKQWPFRVGDRMTL
jgi:type VI secretion system protein ImpG